jgi:hypothetical protein
MCQCRCLWGKSDPSELNLQGVVSLWNEYKEPTSIEPSCVCVCVCVCCIHKHECRCPYRTSPGAGVSSIYKLPGMVAGN